MTSKDNQNAPSLSQTATLLITLVVALAILAGIGLAYQLIVVTATPTPSEVGGPAPTEDWPPPPPTFTATSTPTSKLTPSPTATGTPTPTPTPKPPPPWREMGHLTSIEYPRVSTVVQVERKRPGVGSILGTDKVLLMATGRILIGVDLTQIDKADVQIQGATLKVTLPHATIMSVELLPAECRIYDAEKSWLFSQYEGLEVEALDKARKQLEEETRANKGILQLGELVARLQLSEFLHQVGYEEVEITFK
jgi:hypothetical protein